MKWWFKVNRNKLYRKFNFDPHSFILKSFKLDKSFKFLIAKKKYFRTFLKRRKRRRTKLKFRKIKIYKKFRKKSVKFIKKIKKNDMDKKKWYLNFWNKVKFNYVVKKNKRFFRYKRKKRKFFRIIYNRKKILKRYSYKKMIEKRKKIQTTSKYEFKIKRRKSFFQKIWLYIKKFKKKRTTWWLLRITIRKAAIYYGFKSLKKFRFINRYADSSMSIKSYNNDKLESMLNLFLLRIGLFDNIFISNNFIKMSSLIKVDTKIVFDPFFYIKVKSIISFVNVKRIQSIFKKRCMFSKYFYIKNYKSNRLSKNHCIYSKILVKIVSNVPKYIHYDYQIMCFSVYRFPTNKEKLKRFFNGSVWAVDTKLEYN